MRCCGRQIFLVLDTEVVGVDDQYRNVAAYVIFVVSTVHNGGLNITIHRPPFVVLRNVKEQHLFQISIVHGFLCDFGGIIGYKQIVVADGKHDRRGGISLHNFLQEGLKHLLLLRPVRRGRRR